MKRKILKWLFGEYGIYWSADACSWMKSQTIRRRELKSTVDFLDHYFLSHQVPAFCEIVDMKTGRIIHFWQRHIATFQCGEFTLMTEPPCCCDSTKN